MSTGRPLRLVVAGVSWPVQTFLRRLFDGLTAEGVEVVIAARGRRPRDLPEAYGWRALPTIDRGVPARLVGLARVGLGAFRRAPWTTLRWLGATGSGTGGRLQAADLGRLLPHVGRSGRGRSGRGRSGRGRRFEILYFPWNSGAIDHQPLLDGFGSSAGVPSLVSCRGSQVNVAVHSPSRESFRDALRRSFETVDRVHCVSRAILEESTRHGLDPAKAVVIRPAVDPEVFAPPAVPPPERPPWRLVATGGVDWRKGFDGLLEAVKRLVDTGHDVELDLLGDGPDLQSLRYTAHDLGIEARVRFHGQASPRRVLETLRAGHVYVLSSLSEGIANAALEGMACGLAVVATDVGGMSEAMTDEVDGLLVPSRMPVRLAHAVGRLLDDRALAHRLGAAARRTIVERHALDDQVRAFRALLEEIAASP